MYRLLVCNSQLVCTGKDDLSCRGNLLRYITPPPRERQSPQTSGDVRLLVEAVEETQVEAVRLLEVVVEDADPELHRAEAAASVEAVRTIEAAQEVVQTTEDVLGALEAGQEHRPRARQPCIGL